MCNLGHKRLVRRSEEDDPQNLFASSFLRKDEDPFPRRRRSKYDSGQEIRIGNPESIDVSSGEVIKLYVRERRTGTGRGGRGGNSPMRTTSGP